MEPAARVVAVVKSNTYQDSVRLMELSARLQQVAGVAAAAVMMGTTANKALLAEAGLLRPELEAAGPSDLCIALREAAPEGVDDSAETLSDTAWGAVRALRLIDAFLREEAPRAGPPGTPAPAHSLEGALARLPTANVALISVPGAYAALEARKALAHNLHVFLFSDHVSLADEVTLKTEAAPRGLLVMGPDCGTAIVSGVPLGFANRVPAGPVGLVGASGTGIQEVSSLLARLGTGVSHALGTGSRDLQAEVGGATTRRALALLLADPATHVVVWVSKPGDPATTRDLLATCAAATKPVVAMLLGLDDRAAWQAEYPSVTFAATLEEAARAAAAAVGIPTADWPDDDAALTRQVAALGPEQRALRGLFAGGTLAVEAAALLAPLVSRGGGRRPRPRALSSADPPPGALLARGLHQIVDYGDDAYTQGRAHPMIDPRERQEALRAAGADPDVALVLFDVVLGYGAHPDPAGALVPALDAARAAARARGGDLLCIAHVCGTDADAQSYTAQRACLERAGVVVAASNAQAARYAARALQLLEER